MRSRLVGALFAVPLAHAKSEIGASLGIFGLNTLAYGLALVLVVWVLPGGDFARARAPRPSSPRDARARPRRAGGAGVSGGPLLEVSGLTRRYGGLVAVDDVGFDLPAGGITALVGPNGAGKTTLFGLIAGAIQPSAGSVRFAGEPISGLTAEEICRRGIGRTFQVVRPMRDMTVLENAMVGAFSWTRRVGEARDASLQALELVGLAPKAAAGVDQLTLPDRKMLETARALATRPKLLLLDEVMAGFRPSEADRVVAVLHRPVGTGLTVLLVEHVMRIGMSAAGRVIVLHHGTKIADGAPEAVVRDPAVLRSYLGVADA